MAVTAYDDHSDGEDMPDFVGSDNESNDSKQPHHGDADFASQNISGALLKYRKSGVDIDLHRQ